jgi:hypothetical protein
MNNFTKALGYGGLLLLVLAMAASQPQTPKPAPEPYPGQSQHQKPPEGFYCSPKAKDKAHECHCKRMAVKTKEDPDCCETPPVEDKTCTVWCYADKCLCPIECKAADHDMAGMEKSK